MYARLVLACLAMTPPMPGDDRAPFLESIQKKKPKEEPKKKKPKKPAKKKSPNPVRMPHDDDPPWP
jgi:hypothetical protein